MEVEKRLGELGLELPPAPKPAGVYKPVMVVRGMAYVSGHGPVQKDGTLMTGRVGTDLDLDGAKNASRQTGLAILSSLKAQLGDLDRVQRLVKLLGMVNCTADFREHPAVINGASEMFAQLFGQDHGIGARSAVGMGSLPGNIPVEIEAIFEVK